MLICLINNIVTIMPTISIRSEIIDTYVAFSNSAAVLEPLIILTTILLEKLDIRNNAHHQPTIAGVFKYSTVNNEISMFGSLALLISATAL